MQKPVRRTKPKGWPNQRIALAGAQTILEGAMTLPHTFNTTTLYHLSGASPIVGDGFDFRLCKGLGSG
jgi:hypothetical protein